MTIVGPSGCGKSTLLHMIGGFITPSTGEIRMDGRRIDAPRIIEAVVGAGFDAAVAEVVDSASATEASFADEARRWRRLCLGSATLSARST